MLGRGRHESSLGEEKPLAGCFDGGLFPARTNQVWDEEEDVLIGLL